MKKVKTIIFDNCPVYSDKGELVSYTSKKHALKLVKNKRCELIDEEKFAIRFLVPFIKKTQSLAVEKQNKCVVCGTTKDLTQHHIVPNQYSKEIDFKIIRNLVAICRDCHDVYETGAARILREELADKYNTPLHKEYKSIRTLKTLIDHGNKMPVDVVERFITQIYDDLGVRVSINNINQLHELLEEVEAETNENTHSKIVMRKIEDLDAFYELWISNFIENMKPQYMNIEEHNIVGVDVNSEYYED